MKEYYGVFDWISDPSLLKAAKDRILKFGNENSSAIRYVRNGILHRPNGPAYISRLGSKAWYQDGKLHREDGPAIELRTGTREWYQNGELHRIDGPAVERLGEFQEWYLHGVRHRLDGPAIVYKDGSNSWYVHGYRVPVKSQEDFEAWAKERGYI